MQRPSSGRMIFACINPNHTHPHPARGVRITIETGDVQEVGEVMCSCDEYMELIAIRGEEHDDEEAASND